jgi:hypothetical protein
MRAARVLGPDRAARMFALAIDLDRRSKSGLAGELSRTLEAFACELGGALGATRSGAGSGAARRS